MKLQSKNMQARLRGRRSQSKRFDPAKKPLNLGAAFLMTIYLNAVFRFGFEVFIKLHDEY